MPNHQSETLVLAAGEHHAAVVLDAIAKLLPNNGYDDPRRDARHLLALAMDREMAVLPHEDILLDQDILKRLNNVISRRQNGEPISRMRGYREFYGLEFKISPATLDPRADSEVIVDTVLDYAAENEALRLLDLGTGSGCLLLSSLHYLPKAKGIGVDIQEDAAATAEYNAKSLGLEAQVLFQTGNWDDSLEGCFDIIISNPPYIPKSDLNGLMDEVRLYDPMLALDGGGDGLDAWRSLAPIFQKRLNPDGVAVVEIGIGQEVDVAQIMEKSGLILREQRQDLAGIVRCLVFTLDA